MEEATNGNLYSPEALEGIRKTTAILYEQLQQPRPQEQQPPAIPQKTLKQHHDHLKAKQADLNYTTTMIETLYAAYIY